MAAFKLTLQTDRVIIPFVILLTALAFIQINIPFSHWQWGDSLPPHRMTVDPLVYTWHARQIQESGDLYTFTDSVRGLPHVIPTYPYLQGLLTASLGYLTNVHVHQLEWILVVLETVYVPLGIFIVVRKLFGSKIALFTLAIGLFAPPVWLFKTYIGHWGDVLSFFFVPGVLYLLVSHIRERSSMKVALIGVLLAGMFAGHAFEVVMVSVFVTGWLLIMGFVRSLPAKAALDIITVAGIALLLTAHFFPLIFNIFSETAATKAGGLPIPGAGKPLPAYYPRVHFGLLFLIPTIIGIIYLIQEILKRRLHADCATILLFILFMAGIASTYPWTGYRLYRELYSLYPFFAMVPAIGLYVGMRMATKGALRGSLEVTGILLVAILMAIPAFVSNYGYFSEMAANTIADRQDWDAITWIRENTPRDALVYNLNEYVHGFPIYFVDRNMIDSELNKDSHLYNIAQLCNRTYPERFAARCGGWWSFPTATPEGQPLYITERKGWLGFQRSEGPICKEYPPQKMPGFKSDASYIPLGYVDYVLFQYRGTGRFGQNYDGCMSFFINESLRRGHQIVWNNEKMAVLKVNKGEGA